MENARSVTMVMTAGEYKLAEFAQTEAFPRGQGKVALAFCRKRLTTDAGRVLFASKVKQLVRFVASPKHSGVESVSGTFAGQGAKILEAVYSSKERVATVNAIDFVRDSLFCEWAYVVDLDKLTFEVFKGYVTEPLNAGERFASMTPLDDDYFPVRHLCTFALSELPTRGEFYDTISNQEKEQAESAPCSVG